MQDLLQITSGEAHELLIRGLFVSKNKGRMDLSSLEVQTKFKTDDTLKVALSLQGVHLDVDVPAFDFDEAIKEIKESIDYLMKLCDKRWKQ